jgi:hypothetical protein
VKWVATTVEVTYAFDGANSDPRSGNVAATFRYTTHFTATDNDALGKPTVPLTDMPFIKATVIHDAKFEKLKLKN